MLRIAEAVELTDTGRQREANEDSYFSRAPLFAVADGMGGAQAGEVASRMAVEAFERADESGAAPEELLRRTAQEANREIFDLAQGDSSRSGMGTTLTAALLHGDEISFGHVGDSRAYVFREGRLKQITNDHSLVEELRRQGKLTRDQAADSCAGMPSRADVGILEHGVAKAAHAAVGRGLGLGEDVDERAARLRRGAKPDARQRRHHRRGIDRIVHHGMPDFEFAR